MSIEMKVATVKVISGIIADPVLLLEIFSAAAFLGYLACEFFGVSFSFERSQNSLQLLDGIPSETIHGTSLAPVYSRAPIMTRRTIVGVGGALSEQKRALVEQSRRVGSPRLIGSRLIGSRLIGSRSAKFNRILNSRPNALDRVAASA